MQVRAVGDGPGGLMFHTKNLTEMNFIWTVANPQQAAPRQSLVNRGIIRTAHGAEHLHGAIGYQNEAPAFARHWSRWSRGSSPSWI